MNTPFGSVSFSEDTIGLLASLSQLSGYLSISFWLFAQLPQVIKNHHDKSVEGFSLGFLLCWLGGDLLNFVSCFLNNAMMFQILLSGYYCSVDIILAFQYYYYKSMYHNPQSRWYHRPRRRQKCITSPRTSLRDNLQEYGSTEVKLDSPAGSRQELPADALGRERRAAPAAKAPQPTHVQGIFRKKNTGLSKMVTSALLTGLTKVHSLPVRGGHLERLGGTAYDGGKPNNSVIYRIIIFLSTIDGVLLGKVLAWGCTALYLLSRLPQMHTNYRRGSTKGVSMKLVCFALCGNLFYSLSLVLCEDSTRGGEASRVFWSSELSYLIGALGTVVFDGLLLAQWYRYDGRRVAQRPRSGNLLLQQSPVPGDPPAPQREAAKIRIAAHHRRSFAGRSNPIEMSASVKSTLSPSNIKKISEFTPLSPMDLLLDDFLAKSALPLAATPHAAARPKRSARSSVHSLAKARPVVPSTTLEDDLNMSMDEDDR